jgi:hypothetical protein
VLDHVPKLRGGTERQLAEPTVRHPSIPVDEAFLVREALNCAEQPLGDGVDDRPP